MTVQGGAMARLSQLLQQLERHRLPVHITPVAREMIEAIGSALPFPSGYVLRRLLNPRLTGSVLRLLGERGSALEPMLRNTVNATTVHGGEKINVVPTEIVLEIDGRVLPGYTAEDFIAELRAVIGVEAELEIVLHHPCLSEPDMALFGTLAGILRESDPTGIPLPMLLPGSTDGRFFSQLGIQTYGFTPAALPEEFNYMRSVHAADERIPIEGLHFGTEAIYKLLQRYGSE